MKDSTTVSAPPARPRLTLARFFSDLADEVFSLGRGLPWTFLTMFRDPRAVVRGYIEGADTRATKPFRYFLIVAIAITLLGRAIETEPRPTLDEARAKVEQIIARNVEASQRAGDANPMRRKGYDMGHEFGARVAFAVVYYPDRVMLMLMPFLAAGLFAVFRRDRFNLAEQWVVATYTIAQIYVIDGLLEPLSIRQPAVLPVQVIAELTLFAWICARVYDGPVVPKIARAAFSIGVAIILLLAATLAYVLLLAEWRSH